MEIENLLTQASCYSSLCKCIKR